MNHRILIPSAAAAILLAACSQPSQPAPQTLRPDHDMVAAIRAAGREDQSVVQVKPMRDPRTQALVDQAQRQEGDGQYVQAAVTLNEALKITPDAPGLLQDRAELAIRLHHYKIATQLAMRSWKAGPKVGSLCARNWQTLVEVRQLHDNTRGAAAARKQVAKCMEKGPVRM